MTHGSLETGIGCFDYAADAMQWETVFQCEINTFCQTILKYYWPDAQLFTDLFDMDGRPFRGLIDVLSCGFPCQPFSTAGKGKGDSDDRFIWPQNMRIIRQVQPAYVVAENVPGLLSKHPVVFERVCSDLENEGYEVLPVSIPACATEKDHIRQRLFFLAYNNRFRRVQQSKGTSLSNKESNLSSKEQGWIEQQIRLRRSVECCAANNHIQGLPKRVQSFLRETSKAHGTSEGREYSGVFPKIESWPEAATRLCGVDDGYAGRLDTKTISKARWYRESIRGYGNAVDWKIAFEIFKAIEQMNRHTEP